MTNQSQPLFTESQVEARQFQKRRGDAFANDYHCILLALINLCLKLLGLIRRSDQGYDFGELSTEVRDTTVVNLEEEECLHLFGKTAEPV